MAGQKTKIVLDADVIIHFSKAGKLKLLPRIVPEFKLLVLDVVKREIPAMLMMELNQMITRDKTIIEERFGMTSGESREFARLTAVSGMALGKGESACMVYCRYHYDVLGSSNLKDVRTYCEEHDITYLTTIDFLYYAIMRGVMKKVEAEEFVQRVVALGSKLPIVDFDKYFCDKI